MPSSPPDLSVVVPVYQQWHLVPNLLHAIAAQLDAPAYEIILVDNEPAVEPPQLSTARVIRCDAPGSYAARNLGASVASGKWLVFTDADCEPSGYWLARLGEATKAKRCPLLAGPIEVISRSTKPNALEIYEMVKGMPQEAYLQRNYAATANLSVERAVFEKLGGFHGERFSGGDAEFCRRAARHGQSISFVPDALVYHPARKSWSAVATKARRIKGGQITAGPANQRRAWALRSLVPPLRGVWRFLFEGSHPLRYRLIAVAVLLALWVMLLGEVVRLGLGGQPERR